MGVCLYPVRAIIGMTIALRLSLVPRVHTAFIVNGQSLVKVEEI